MISLCGHPDAFFCLKHTSTVGTPLLESQERGEAWPVCGLSTTYERSSIPIVQGKETSNNTAGSMTERLYISYHFFFDLFVDLTCYVFARAVLFNLSSFELFVALLAKDFLQDFWYFGLNYLESAIIFGIKSMHPEGRQMLSANRLSRFKWLIWFRSRLNFYGIPYTLAPMWYLTLDMNELN